MKNKKTGHVIGVDIGGTHVAAGLVDISSKTFVDGSLVRNTVDPHAATDDIIGQWSATIRQVAQVFEYSSYHVGIAMPGPFDYNNGISLIKGFNKYEALYGLNVKELLGAQLGIPCTAIKLKNDAAAFLRGECFFGAAVGFQKAVGITLGTGLGSAHKVGDDTEECAVNVSPLHDGIAEDYISIRWFLRRYTALAGYRPANVKYIADRVGSNGNAAQVFHEFATNLTEVLRRFISREQPDVVVLGGGIANAFPLFYPVLQKQLATGIAVRQSLLGEAAAMCGAAFGWNNELDYTNLLTHQ